MEWLRAHPYQAVLGVVALIIVGALIVNMRAPAAVPGQTIAWSGSGAILNPSPQGGGTVAQTPTPNLMQQVEGSAPYTYIAPAQQTSGVASNDTSGGSFDFNAFVAMLSQENAPKGGSSAGGGSASSAYSFLPGGLISTSTPAKSRTTLQQALYEYGNTAGSYIQSFETEHSNESQVVVDQAQDRTDSTKAAAVEALGAALTGLGQSLSQIDTIPDQATKANQALAASYEDIGAKLALVPQAQSDSGFISAVQTYDAAANTFITNYVALANLFGAYGVTFAPDDPGSVFTFSPTGL